MLIRMPLFELCSVVLRGILHATVRMMDKPRPWAASHQGHTQRFQDKSGFQTALQGQPRQRLENASSTTAKYTSSLCKLT
jgi:hypothetical protein